MERRLLSVIVLLLALAASRIVYGQDGERTIIRIAVQPDGSARWTISYETDLITDEDRATFDEYSNEVSESRVLLLSEFSDTIRNLVSRASSLTGRAMSARDFNLTASIVYRITAKVGVIEYSFTWVNFAKVEDRTVTIGDVFEGGLYLYENDVLVIVYPQSLYLREIRPLPDLNKTNEVIWSGRRNFELGEPYLLLEDRRTSLRLSLSKSKLEVGGLLEVSGQVDPPIEGAPITLRLVGPSSTKTIPLTTLADGSFHSSLTLEEPGDWTIYASFQGYGAYLGSESDHITVSVTQPSLMQSPLMLIATVSVIAVVFIVAFLASRNKRKSSENVLLTRTDFDLVMEILRDAGGVMPQPRLRELTRFSGAKLSRILKEMENRGEIRRAKKGREQIVFLVEKR